MNKNLNELLELKNYVNYLIEMVLTENPFNLNAMGMKHVQNYYKPANTGLNKLNNVIKKPMVDNTTKIAQGKVDALLARKRIDSMKPIPQEDWPLPKNKTYDSNKIEYPSVDNPHVARVDKEVKDLKQRYNTDFNKAYGINEYERSQKPKIDNWEDKYHGDKVYKDTLFQIGIKDKYNKYENGQSKTKENYNKR